MTMRIVPGRNDWRVAVRLDQGSTRSAILARMRYFLPQLLAPFQGPVNWNWTYHYGSGGHTHWAWGIGDARPAEALDAEQAMPGEAPRLERGAVLGQAASLAALGAGPYWFVTCWIWWRGAEKSIDAWPIALGTDPILGLPLPGPPVAWLDEARDPDAPAEARDLSVADVAREQIASGLEITLHDAGELLPRRNDPLPWVIAAGAAGLFAVVAAKRLTPRRY